MNKPAIVLFRRDLRIADNAALRAAMAQGSAAGLYVLDDGADGRPLGGAGRWWLHHAILRLRRQLAGIGVPLLLRSGDQNTAAVEVAAVLGAGALYWNRRYTPWGMRADAALRSKLESLGIASESFEGAYLREPGSMRTKQGAWFKVFTPFYNASLAMGEPPAPLPSPDPQAMLGIPAESEPLESWQLLPTGPDWASGLREAWLPETSSAESQLRKFLRGPVVSYASGRERPDLEGTSAISPYLAFGELSPRQLWHAAQACRQAAPACEPGIAAFLRQLVWRDFCANLLYHFPDLARRPFQEKFSRFPTESDPEALRAWQRGRTGYPWVDAGMRQLWVTGWMHNRVRMGAASFLTKHLLLPWQWGEAWFWDTLVDADPAQNIANWQWVAGCGADAAPYFRIFNPTKQGEKFDRTGGYLMRWQPRAGCYEPGSAGIAPIIGHPQGRERALAAFRSLSRG